MSLMTSEELKTNSSVYKVGYNVSHQDNYFIISFSTVDRMYVVNNKSHIYLMLV